VISSRSKNVLFAAPTCTSTIFDDFEGGGAHSKPAVVTHDEKFHPLVLWPHVTMSEVASGGEV
jgi:hypothetical protein